VVEATTANGVCTMRIKAIALSGPIATAVDENADLIRMTLAAATSTSNDDQTEDSAASPSNDAADASVNGTAATDPAVLRQHESTAGVSGTADRTGGTLADLDITDDTGQPSVDEQSQSAAVEAPEPGGANGTSSAEPGQSAAEALSDAERVSRSHEGSGDEPQGGRSPSGDLGGIDGTKGRATGINENGVTSPSGEEGGNLASGKVGILKQRLLAAAKEAKAGSSDVLKVLQNHNHFETS